MTQCQYFAGAALFGGGFTVDADGDLEAISNADASLTFHHPVADWEAQGLDEPSINVSDHTDDTDWLAGEVSGLNVDPELSKIETWTLDGASASGTDVFVERNSILSGTP